MRIKSIESLGAGAGFGADADAAALAFVVLFFARKMNFPSYNFHLM